MGFSGNQVTVSGNLVRDPETKTLGSGTLVTEFSVAWNERRKQGDEWVDVAHFFDVTMWGKVGASIGQQCSKGDPVAFWGSLRQQRWKAPDGTNRSKVGIVAFDAMPGKRGERQGGGYGAPPPSRRDMDDGGGWSGGGGSSPAASAGPDAGWDQQPPPPAADDIPFAFRFERAGQETRWNDFDPGPPVI